MVLRQGMSMNASLRRRIMLVSSTPLGFQEMIKNLQKYCEIWKLTCKNKKIMVFKRGGKLGVKKC